VTASNQAKTYGQTAALGTTAFTTAGLVNGDSVSGVTLASSGAPAGASVAGSPYAITPSNAQGSGLGNYTISFVNGALSVNPAGLTVTASNQAKTYGHAAALGTTAFTIAGLVNGDTVSSVSLASAGAPASATVAGSPYAITPSAAAGTGLANYTISYVNGALSVNPAGLTAALTGTVSKTFDGTTAATLADSNYILHGVVGEDNVVLNNPTTGSYASANVGVAIPVSVSGLALSGAAAVNYVLASTNATADIGIITPVPGTSAPTGEILFPLTQPQPVAEVDSLTVYPFKNLVSGPLYTISGDLGR